MYVFWTCLHCGAISLVDAALNQPRAETAETMAALYHAVNPPLLIAITSLPGAHRYRFPEKDGETNF